jgi:phospholipid/cholesterol/gamma-HCH transport system substrate-binding protein
MFKRQCESDQNYVPLNDGDAWKGDPIATDAGQGVPQFPLPPAAALPAGTPVGTPPPVGQPHHDR